MVPDRQKVRTDGWKDGRNGRTEGQTHGRRQNYIPPTSSGDNESYKSSSYIYVLLLLLPRIIPIVLLSSVSPKTSVLTDFLFSSFSRA